MAQQINDQLNHIADGIETTCKAVTFEIQSDCRLENFRRQGTIIDLEFVVGEKYGNREWIMPIIEPQPVIWFAANEPPPTSTDFKTIRYRAVKVIGPVHHPIPREFWQTLAGELVTAFLMSQTE